MGLNPEHKPTWAWTAKEQAGPVGGKSPGEASGKGWAQANPVVPTFSGHAPDTSSLPAPL